MRHLCFWFLCILSVPSFAQNYFEILSLEGIAKVQRAQKRNWDDLSLGDKLHDNDMVETFFQTKILLRFGSEGNTVILGPNSKALFNIIAKEKNGKKISEVSLTLFSGGIFAKSVAQNHVSIYTANAVGEMDSGSVSAVAEAKTGETGFQALGGSVVVRNIAQQTGKELRPGQTTMILPGKEPTAPLHITFRHVAVLKHYFGEDYISGELDAAGIKPTDDRTTGRLKLTRNLPSGAEKGANTESYERLFSLERIYGSILEDRSEHSGRYSPIIRYANYPDRMAYLHNRTSMGVSQSGLYPLTSLVTSFRKGYIDVGARLTIAKNAQQKIALGFSTPEGWLDKIHHVTVGDIDDSLLLHFGTIRDLTLGNGLMVNRLDARYRNSVFNPLGAYGRFSLFTIFTMQGFIADILHPAAGGGAYISLDNGYNSLGCGYYFDTDGTHLVNGGNNARFVEESATDENVSGAPLNSQVIEVDFGTTVISHYDFSFGIFFELARDIFNKGMVIRLPWVETNWKRNNFGGGLIMESGSLFSNRFGPTYFSNRLFVGDGTFESTEPPSIHTNLLSPSRKARAFELFYRTNPISGMAIDMSLKRDFYSSISEASKNDTLFDTTIQTKNNYSYDINVAINDEIFSYISYGNLYLRQINGALFPPSGTIFASWGFETGFGLVSEPIVYNMAFEIGGDMYFLNANPSNSVGDRVLELYLGLKWSFM